LNTKANSISSQIIIFTQIRTIEVMFRELKQHLQLGKCQSRDFDAQIASVTISMILYIFLSYFRRMNAYESIGGLFELIKDDICEKNSHKGYGSCLMNYCRWLLMLLQKVVMWTLPLSKILLNTYTSRNFLRHHF